MPKPILIFLAAVYGALGISSQCYLVSATAVERDLNITSGDIQFSNSCLHIGALLAVAAGPLIDRYGRKKGLLSGLVLYILAAVGLIFINSYDQLLIVRVILGVAMGVLVTVTFPIMNDWNRSSEDHNARHLSIIVGLTCLIPITIPLLAEQIMQDNGWRSLMVMMVIYGCILLFWTCCFIEESARSATSSLKDSLIAYKTYLQDPATRFLLLSMGSAIAALITLTASVPLLLKDDFHLTGHKTALFLSFVLTVKAITCFGNLLLTRSFSLIKILSGSIIFRLITVLLLLLFADSYLLFISGTALFLIPVTLIYISSKAMLIARYPGTTGTVTSACILSVMVLATLCTMILGVSKEASIWQVSLVMLGLSLIPVIAWIIDKKDINLISSI